MKTTVVAFSNFKQLPQFSTVMNDIVEFRDGDVPRRIICHPYPQFKQGTQGLEAGNFDILVGSVDGSAETAFQPDLNVPVYDNGRFAKSKQQGLLAKHGIETLKFSGHIEFNSDSPVYLDKSWDDVHYRVIKPQLGTRGLGQILVPRHVDINKVIQIVTRTSNYLDQARKLKELDDGIIFQTGFDTEGHKLEDIGEGMACLRGQGMFIQEFVEPIPSRAISEFRVITNLYGDVIHLVKRIRVSEEKTVKFPQATNFEPSGIRAAHTDGDYLRVKKYMNSIKEKGLILDNRCVDLIYVNDIGSDPKFYVMDFCNHWSLHRYTKATVKSLSRTFLIDLVKELVPLSEQPAVVEDNNPECTLGSISRAVGVLTDHLTLHPEYRMAWRSNIAMAMYDQGLDQRTANVGAEVFLDNLCQPKALTEEHRKGPFGLVQWLKEYDKK